MTGDGIYTFWVLSGEDTQAVVMQHIECSSSNSDVYSPANWEPVSRSSRTSVI